MSPIKSDPHPAAPLPDECQTMTDVRKGVDSLDREIVRLLVIRQGYMHAAARIKKSRDAVYDEERIEDVVAKVLVEAKEVGEEEAVCARTSGAVESRAAPAEG